MSKWERQKDKGFNTSIHLNVDNICIEDDSKRSGKIMYEKFPHLADEADFDPGLADLFSSEKICSTPRYIEDKIQAQDILEEYTQNVIQNSRLNSNSNTGKCSNIKQKKRLQDDSLNNIELEYFKKLKNKVYSAEPSLPSCQRNTPNTKITNSVNNADSLNHSYGTNTESEPDIELDSESEASLSVSSQNSSPQVVDRGSGNSNKTNTKEEISRRTVFLSNVSIEAIRNQKSRKVLFKHLSSIFPTNCQDGDLRWKIISLRFRSIPFSSLIPKRAAYAQRAIMDATTKSTNAYVQYSSEEAANLAIENLNGSMVLDRHLRVDSVFCPAEIDSRRCIFVGNLSFMDDESAVKEEADSHKPESDKPKRPSKIRHADTEEGLWRQFNKIGRVENVRVVRDARTRVSKGFAYVQFKDVESVQKALKLDGQKFPPLLPRNLRVTRAKQSAVHLPKSHPNTLSTGNGGRKTGTNKLKNRSSKLKRSWKSRNTMNQTDLATHREIFEGHRASASDMVGKRKSKSNSTLIRQRKRSEAWRKNQKLRDSSSRSN